MNRFKTCREILLLSYANNNISDEEFVPLYDCYRSKNPDFGYQSYDMFDVENMNSADCKAEFRVEKADLPLAFSSSLIFLLNFFRSRFHRSRTAFLSFSWNFGQWISFRLSTIASHASPRAGLPFFVPKTFLASISLRKSTSCSSLHSIGLEWNNGTLEVKYNA